MDHVETAPRLNGAGEFAIKQQVGKILRSRGFASERHARLLKYLLAKTLDGGVAELKEYTLAVEVFHRSEDFDPQTDAIVRTELSRLRGKLKSYYENEGQRDELLVDLPNRSYSLTFTLRSEVPRPVAARSPKWGWIGASAVASVCLTPCVAYLLWWASDTGKWAAVEPDVNVVAVLPFANPDGNPEVEHFSNSLMDEVIRCLGEIDGLRVISRNSALPLKDTAEHLRSSAAKLNVGVIVEGCACPLG